MCLLVIMTCLCRCGLFELGAGNVLFPEGQIELFKATKGLHSELENKYISDKTFPLFFFFLL